ncbi:MAG TPA: hypothetical protein EYQ31_16095 [Candidatus Handelsmanbacteria bacterium]|nr:hypothetical protein [Candidatus Latescibacterota bacterium]HIG18677.1 hypothetical protein [Candidatus Handelsmanbacteria bacterium]
MWSRSSAWPRRPDRSCVPPPTMPCLRVGSTTSPSTPIRISPAPGSSGLPTSRGYSEPSSRISSPPERW